MQISCPPQGSLLSLVAFALVMLSIVAQGQPPMVMEGDASAVHETYITLSAGVPVTIETRNLSAGSDPVLNLLSTDGTEVAADDNSAGGFASRITYTPSKSSSYILIMRAKISSKKGTADIYKDGTLWRRGRSFGGWQTLVSGLRKGEVIETVKIPNGASGLHRIYILKGDAIGILTRIVGGGTLDGALYTVPTTLGSKFIVIGTNFGSEGVVRLVRNDCAIPGHDPDKDGLGSELEAAVGTCSSLTGFAQGFDCRQAVDARDTDGDGISDNWEVLGRRDMKPHQPLPVWGANPRHKDLFIEVDFMRRTGGENENKVTNKMQPDVARRFASVYGDTYTTDPLLKAYHAAILRNPDGQPGINVHLDIGLLPESESDVTIYGDWGGFNAVDAVKSSGKPCDKETNDTNCKSVKASMAWKEYMNPVRRGIFRYGLGYTTGGASCGDGFACDFNFHDSSVTNHEWGHTMGLGHSGSYGTEGDPNCSPNYVSIMNYAYLSEPDTGFADGTLASGGPSLNNWQLKEWEAVSPRATAFLDKLEKTFGYTVDRERGHVDWNRDGVFAQSGKTIRAYSNFKPGGSCEYTKWNMVGVGNAKSTQTPAIARLENRLYVFYVDNGMLKYTFSNSRWNCPEVASIGCGGGSWEKETDAGIESYGVDVANIRVIQDSKQIHQLLVVTVDGRGRLWERRMAISAGNEVWSPAIRIPGTATGEPSLASIDIGFSAYLAYKGTDLNIHFNRLVTNTGWEGDEVALTNDGDPIRSTTLWAFPTVLQTYLKWKPLKSLYGAFPDKDGMLDVWWLNVNTKRWEKTNVLVSDTLVPPNTPDDRRPLPVPRAVGEEKDNLSPTRPGPIYGRAAMAWVPYQAHAEYPGRLYLMYITQPQLSTTDPFNGTTRMRISYVTVSKEVIGGREHLKLIEKVGLDSYFDNVWHYAYGIDLLYEAGIDSNLRAVYSLAGKEAAGKQFDVRFRPKADGINDVTYTNHNDWEVLRPNLCKRVVNPGGLVRDPIKCP